MPPGACAPPAGQLGSVQPVLCPLSHFCLPSVTCGAAPPSASRTVLGLRRRLPSPPLHTSVPLVPSMEDDAVLALFPTPGAGLGPADFLVTRRVELVSGTHPEDVPLSHVS